MRTLPERRSSALPESTGRGGGWLSRSPGRAARRARGQLPQASPSPHPPSAAAAQRPRVPPARGKPGVGEAGRGRGRGCPPGALPATSGGSRGRGPVRPSPPIPVFSILRPRSGDRSSWRCPLPVCPAPPWLAHHRPGTVPAQSQAVPAPSQDVPELS